MTIDGVAAHWPPGSVCPAEDMALLAALLAALAELGEWKSEERRLEIRRLARCSHCNAPPGQPCTRPDGRPYVNEGRYPLDRGKPLHHAPRLDIMAHRFNTACVNGWYGDLRYSPSCIRTVTREVRASSLHRALVRAGLLEPLEGK